MVLRKFFLSFISCFFATSLLASEPQSQEVPGFDETNLFCRLPREIIHDITSLLWEEYVWDTDDESSKYCLREARKKAVAAVQHTCRFLYYTATVPKATYTLDLDVSKCITDPAVPGAFIRYCTKCIDRIRGRQGNNFIDLCISCDDGADLQLLFDKCSEPAIAPMIKSITLRGGPVTHIPPTIQNLPILQKLYLFMCCNFKFDKEDIQTLARVKSLKSLWVKHSSFTTLDPDIAKLCHLPADEVAQPELAECANIEDFCFAENLHIEDLRILQRMPFKILSLGRGIPGRSNLTYEDIIEELTDFRQDFPARKIMTWNLKMRDSLPRHEDLTDYMASKARWRDPRVDFEATED